MATPSVSVHTKSIYVSTTKRLTGKWNYTWQSLPVFPHSEVLLGIWIIVIFLLGVNNDLEIDCHMPFIINKNAFSCIQYYSCFLDHQHRQKYSIRTKKVISCRKKEHLRQSFLLALSTGYSAVCFCIKWLCLDCGVNAFWIGFNTSHSVRSCAVCNSKVTCLCRNAAWLL